MSSKTLNIIYDGQCGFCVRSLKIVRRFDVYRTLRFHDSHRADTLADFPSLSEVKVDEAMYTLVEGEPLYSGFYAFRRLIWNSPLTWILIPIFYFPGAGFFGTRIYAWIARNRSSFGCYSDVCDLTSPPAA
jgi:predicted DCC family thiol-disulfide oxidoreductase YuxK